MAASGTHPTRPARREGGDAVLRAVAGGVVLTLALGACAPRGPEAPAPPPIDGRELALSLERETRLELPARVLFEWNLNEQGARASGRGLARAEPPYRARLDLFLSNGETVARAALLDDQLLVPDGVPEGIIPPPDLLWAALGVFRPGRDAALLGAAGRIGEDVELRYGYAGGRELRYRITGNRIREAELLQGGRAVHRVSLVADGENGRYPREATYRNLGAFRELKLVTQTVEHVDSYPPDIWYPSR